MAVETFAYFLFSGVVMHWAKGWAIWISVMLIFAVFVRNCEFAQESIRSGVHVYSYKPWVLVGIFFGGLVFSAWIYKSPEPAAWAGATRYDVGPCGAVVSVVLSLVLLFHLNSHVVGVSENGIEIRGRFLGYPSTVSDRSIQFTDLKLIRLVSEQVRSGGSRTGGAWRTHYNLFFEGTGTTTKMSVNNDVSRMAAARVLELASVRGIPVSQPYAADAERWSPN